MKFATIRGRNDKGNLRDLAFKWAQELHVEFLPRQAEGSLQDVLKEYNLDCLLIATQNGPQIYTEEGILRFHPGMAVLRLENLRKGQKDNFAVACGLEPGNRFLDCTLGFASDSAIASYLVGSAGKVVGLEASPPLWYLVKQGLKTYQCENPLLTDALRRITTVNSKAEDYLAALPADSFDVVYFDPMFQHPIQASSNMVPLRPVAYHKQLDKTMLAAALRVAPKVVVKEHTVKVLADLGLTEIVGGKYSHVKFGVLRR